MVVDTEKRDPLNSRPIMKLKITFLGAAQNVTGSRYLLETDNCRLLVDCGFFQERDFRSRNWDPFPVPPESVNAMLLTHAHLDHCGLLPRFVENGFGGRIYCTEATQEIAQIVMLDSGKIQEEDAKYKIKRHKRQGRVSPRPIVPLYTKDQAEKVRPLFQAAPFKQKVQVADGITATFFESGHILGASSIQVEVLRSFDGEAGDQHLPPSLARIFDHLFKEF